MKYLKLLRVKLFMIFFISVAFINGYVNSQTYTPKYGIHTDPGLILNYPDTVEGFVMACARNEYKAIMYMVTSAHELSGGGDGTMDHWFMSPTCENRLGSIPKPDHLAEFVAACDSYNMELFIDIQALGQVARNPTDYPYVSAPTINDVVNIIQELAGYGIDGISEEMFPSEWFEEVGQACRNSGIQYVHKAIPWDMGGLSTMTPNKTVFEAYANSDVILTEDYDKELLPPFLIGGEQFAYIAKGLGKDYQLKLWTNESRLGPISNITNIALMKALQLHPSYIYVMTWDKNFVDNYNWDTITNIISQYVSFEKKPLCNVVMYLTGDENPDTWDWWEFPLPVAAVSNGIKASGYDIITTPEPVDTADMYYIVTRGQWGNWGNSALDLPQTIMQIFNSTTTVFLQVIEDLPKSTNNWRTVREKLGIDTAKVFNKIGYSDSILYGDYNGMIYPHLTKSRYFNNILTTDVTSGKVISVADFGNTSYSLVIRNGNKFFVNGSEMDPRMSFVISNCINNGLQRPTSCVIAAGKEASYFYALEDTELEIKLPDSLVNHIEWFKRDIKGKRITGTTQYDHSVGYTDFLSKGTLLILKSSRINVTSVKNSNNASPQFLLIYPNPFSNSITIKLKSSKAGKLNIKVYDLTGKEIATIFKGSITAGEHSFVFNADGLNSGIYLLRANTSSLSLTKKIMMVR